jgi:hypothetical protein
MSDAERVDKQLKSADQVCNRLGDLEENLHLAVLEMNCTFKSKNLSGTIATSVFCYKTLTFWGGHREKLLSWNVSCEPMGSVERSLRKTSLHF